MPDIEDIWDDDEFNEYERRNHEPRGNPAQGIHAMEARTGRRREGG
jgi:hypothetical protein